MPIPRYPAQLCPTRRPVPEGRGVRVLYSWHLNAFRLQSKGVHETGGPQSYVGLGTSAGHPGAFASARTAPGTDRKHKARCTGGAHYAQKAIYVIPSWNTYEMCLSHLPTLALAFCIRNRSLDSIDGAPLDGRSRSETSKENLLLVRRKTVNAAVDRRAVSARRACLGSS